MRKLFSCLLMVLGGILLIGALIFTWKNLRETDQAGQSSQEDLQAVQQIIPTSLPESTEASEAPEDCTTLPPHPEVMAEENVNGRIYIGYLSIPSLELELPVLSQWSYPNLRVAPCRHQGTTWGDDLVIAAHNYPVHFGRLHDLTEGEPVTFTDMEGNLNEYTVGTVESVDPSDEAHVLDSDWDLVLYTCTPGGQMRVMAGLKRLQNAPGQKPCPESSPTE